ncbi:MAG: hypothetical protein GXO79_00345 [Chlorobi bacterium]|nr:hypothetical protein [Chlorobiota bacterium]
MEKALTIFVVGISLFYFNINKYSSVKTGTTTLVSAQDTVKACISCHTDLMQYKYKHMPAEESCENCHLAKEENHLKEFFKGEVLLERVPALCYTCHDEKNNKKHVHVPVDDGDCLECHSVHSSDNNHLLKQNTISKLCAECHDIRKADIKSKHQPVISGDCIKCHNPHQSDYRNMLKSKSPDLCFSCHKKMKAEIDNPDVHVPFADDCNECHEPHYSKEKHLLTDKVPILCYNCHEEKSTKKNVHYPVEEGECFSCHEPHSAQNSALLTLPVGSTCYQCHDIKKSKVMHQPVKEGKCIDCHNPHQSDNKSFLRKKAGKLCYDCHAKEKKESSMKTIHPPFDDDCSNCHKPHNSDEPYLLNVKETELCFECHEKIEGKAHIHQPVKEKKCVECHSPHASNEENLLKDSQVKVCLSCHSKAIKTETKTIINIGQKLQNSTVKHGAIEMAGCTACHNAHASNYSSLLSKEFSAYEYTKAEAKSFELCFDCHDSQIIKKDAEPGSTNFRNGDNNLHYLHINGTKGRNCTMCHDVHASKNKHLIADKVLFGSWEMPLNYKSYSNGGSCATGCHGKKIYVK